jgi:Zn-dependent protease with chaperone function
MTRRSVLLPAVFAAAANLAAAAAPAPAVQLDGYAEWVEGGTLFVDGQRVRLAAGGRFEGGGRARRLVDVPPGYEVRARGRRAADGTVLADEIEAKPNGSALFEGQVLAVTNEAEASYRRAGFLFEETNGRRKTIGRLHESGPEVDRVGAMLERLRPPYLAPGTVRAYVVDNEEWNAFAMGNYSVYVFRGILRDLDDDELAIVLGHELAHATHEHTRRQFKKQMWVQIAALGASVAAGEIDDGDKRAFAQLLAAFTALAWTNGYGRELEDQADRVGLRYAYEAGYDVTRGPLLWKRFAAKYGEPGRVANFFFANHSRSSARALNLERQLALNYPPGASAAYHARAVPPAAGEPGRRADAAPSPKAAAALVTRGGPGDSARGVEAGMSVEDVRVRLGPPDRQIRFGGRMHWTYPGGSIVFEHDKVAEVRF